MQTALSPSWYLFLATEEEMSKCNSNNSYFSAKGFELRYLDLIREGISLVIKIFYKKKKPKIKNTMVIVGEV